MKNLIKKFLVIAAVILSASATFSLTAPEPAHADCRLFLGLSSWDCNTRFSGDTTPTEDIIKQDIWTVVLNVVNDIMVIAAYLVIGYVIYGGYLYTFSGGEPGKIATGKKALYHAFLGLAIVMGAWAIMSTIRFALLGGNNLGNCVTASCIDPGTMITNAIQWAIGIAGAVSAIFVVYGGISYMSSNGDPSKLQKAKSMITYALIGLAIVALAEIITAFVSSMIRNSISQTNITTISKEVHEIKNL